MSDNNGYESPTQVAKSVGRRSSARQAEATQPRPELDGRQPAAVEKKAKSVRPFPACPFEEAVEFAKIIHDFGSGRPVRRLTLFDHLKKSPDSGPSRQLITNTAKYGLTKGGYQAEALELTIDGAKAVDDEQPKREQAKARIALAIEAVPTFKRLYDDFVTNKLPSKAALVDAAVATGLPAEYAPEAIETFIVNLRYLGLLQTLSGAERIVSIDHYLESLPSSGLEAKWQRPQHGVVASNTSSAQRQPATGEQAMYETTCFYVTPIGDQGSEERQHSDLMLGSIVEPALEEFGLTVVRADQIDKPGLITRQVFDYLLKARLVVVDLSFHNPNVFYELAIRHAARLPVVQIIRTTERIPFDVNQMRTIQIDTTSIYTLVPQIQTYVAQIASHVRRAMQDPDNADNPLTTFYPAFRVQL